MTKLVSEQLPNDGAYHIKRLVNEANGRLKQIGKQGKRATIVAKKTSLSLQFTFKDGNGRPQKNVGLGGIPVSAKGVEEAEKIAQMVTNQLTANQFTWGWFNNLIGKPTSEQTKQLTCKEMVEQYKEYYFKQRKDNKVPKVSWYQNCSNIETTFNNIDKPISLSLIREVIECTANNSEARKTTLNGLVGFLKYFDISDYKQIVKNYKANNKIKRKVRNVPNDEKIIEIYKNGFVPRQKCPKKYFHRYSQWQFLYSLLATYGLRIHEAWNIANWDKPVTLKGGDWVAIDLDNDNSIELQRDAGDLIIPAILDPNNKDYILCIKHDTKTGYRMTMPISPEGHNWIEEFNLLQPLNLPDIEEPLKRTGDDKGGTTCTSSTCDWFKRHKYGFAPHDLRHAYNHRGHYMSYNPKALADSLGHSVTMNSTGYLRHTSDSVKLKGMTDTIKKEQNKRSENELLKKENRALKAENTTLKQKIELLETKLKLNSTFTKSE